MSRQSPSKDADGLSIQERLFVRHYLASNGNGAQSAQRAGYSGDCAKRARQLLARAHVWRVVERTTRAKLSQLDITVNKVLSETARIALADPRRFFHADGTLLPVSEWPEDVAAAVSGFEFGKTGLIAKIRLCSKVSAVQLLGMYLNLWNGAGNKSPNRLEEIVEALRSLPEEEKKETIN